MNLFSRFYDFSTNVIIVIFSMVLNAKKDIYSFIQPGHLLLINSVADISLKIQAKMKTLSPELFRVKYTLFFKLI